MKMVDRFKYLGSWNIWQRYVDVDSLVASASKAFGALTKRVSRSISVSHAAKCTVYTGLILAMLP